MSLVYVSADIVFPRTVGLLNNPAVDLLRVRPPMPTVHRERNTGGDRTLHNMVLWGPIERPDFEPLSPEDDAALLEWELSFRK
jgi:hypothetical protein